MNWQQQLAEAFTSLGNLCDYLELAMDSLPVSAEAGRKFPFRVPRQFADRMEKGNPEDPLLRQVLPVRDELIDFPGYSLDPVGDLDAVTRTGFLHKYAGRVLMINTGTCAINCRYCFRRNFPYADHRMSRAKEAEAIQVIRDDFSISEVILSGGDPLLLSDQRLLRLVNELSAIAHVRRIRIHSRLPIVLPARMTDELITLLAQSAKPVILVVHCNHPQEIDQSVAVACHKLKTVGVTLLNQSVLLKNINDRADTLCELSEKLFAIGIMPYYLHQLDTAAGTGHFEVPKSEAVKLIQEIQGRLPGYLVPKLVIEQPGAPSKQYLLESMSLYPKAE